MTTTALRRPALLAAALFCFLAIGCQRAPDGPPATASTPATEAAAGTDGDRSFIGRKAAQAMEMAGQALRTENIALGENTGVIINGRRFGSGRVDKNLPRAELTPEGVLLIDGKPVDATPQQQALLLEYRRQLEGIALAGMAIGAQGADIAGTALSGVGEAVFGGEEGRRAFEARIEAEAGKVEQEAMRLCELLPGLYDSQRAAAAAVPEIVPYATMTQQDVEDCGDDARDRRGDGTHAAVDAGHGPAAGRNRAA